MEIQINVLNEMKKLRTSTYSDRYTWVDELVQNAQRAKASRVRLSIDWCNRTITVEDNGCGCTDPQVLFRKSDTGWDQSVVQEESPFGEGFFSTMMAANTITVSSVGFNAVFDVNKMFETGDIDCVDVTPNRQKSGFKVVLSDLVENCYMSEVEKRFRETCKFIKSPAGYVDKEKVHYEGLMPQEHDKFFVKLDNEMFTGWMIPHSWRHHQFDDNWLKVFAYDRYVKDMPHHDCVNGVLLLKPGAVILRSPDRHDIIRDEKYERFSDLVEDGIKQVMAKILRYGDDTIIKAYDSFITKYLTPEECKKYIKFKYLNKVKDKPETDDDADEECELDYLPDNSADIIDEEIAPPTVEITPVVTIPQASTTTATAIEPKKKRTTPVSDQTGESIDDLKFGFYVEESQIEMYSDDIELAKYYNFPIISVRNSIEMACLTNTMPHIKPLSELQGMLEIKCEYKNTDPANEAEWRAYNILNTIGNKIAARNNMFIIADVKSIKALNVNDTYIDVENMNVFAVAYRNQIYVDRNHIRTSGIGLTNDSSTITDADKRFILLNSETIVHEMAHVMYDTNDNTKAHAEAEMRILQQIITLLYD